MAAHKILQISLNEAGQTKPKLNYLLQLLRIAWHFDARYHERQKLVAKKSFM
jgi:hypothetical protein